MPTPLPTGIYGITAEKFSNGRSNVAVALEMIRGGVSVLQYREKHADKSIRTIYEECRRLREITRDHGVMFIVNDFIDIAMLVDADGVHVGQDDLPVAEVRKLVGDKVIGLSTHSPVQARAALADGADYIGVGPIYETHTKDNVCAPVGLEYLEWVVTHVPMPFVAIGGIKETNIREVRRRGARTVCLVTDIVGAADISGKVKGLISAMSED
ncbi:MAG: thiamine phosphate synthase [Desulfobacterales bacterium]|jgi:thiamine-phosphate pyrophosphorylase|nr:thiamine phosphate synthase [Desulfobacterales bacterium]